MGQLEVFFAFGKSKPLKSGELLQGSGRIRPTTSVPEEMLKGEAKSLQVG